MPNRPRCSTWSNGRKSCRRRSTPNCWPIQYAVFRTLLQAFYSVQLTGRFEGPATHLLAQSSSRDDKDWSTLLPQLTEHTVPGTHHTIWAGDNLAVLSEVVDRVLRSQVAPCR